MKLLKSLAIISLASLFAFSTAQADTKQKQKKQTTKQTQKKQTNQKKQNTKKNTKKAPTAEESLKQFNQHLKMRLAAHRVIQGSDGKPLLVLKYEFLNKGNKAIKAVRFVGGITYNNEVILAQEIPLNFGKTGLKAHEHVVLDLSIPFDKVPEKSRPILMDSSAKVGQKNAAEVLVFTDNTGIVVKSK